MIKNFYSNGKLLITGEYLVLDGAIALALPTKFGQSLQVKQQDEKCISWESVDNENNNWLKIKFDFEEVLNFNSKIIENNSITSTLLHIISEAYKLNPTFLNLNQGLKVTTKLNFPRDWGLGSSSTLINNIASWAKIDAFKLSEATLGGSGYDIAAAQNNSPILYSNKNKEIHIQKISIPWGFTDQLFFIHLNKKQNSRDGIKHYHQNKKETTGVIEKINTLSYQICNCNSITEFEILILKHEQIISTITQQKTIKEQLFHDYPRAIKSLGAWGGDFILAIGDHKNKDYFKEKGYTTILSFQEMIE